MIYAETRALRSRQLASDLLVVLVVAASIWCGLAVHDLVSVLAEPGEALQEAGEGLAGAAGRAEAIRDVPIVGGALVRPFAAVSGSGERLAGAGTRLQELARAAALAAGALVALLPALVVLGLYLPARVRWIGEAGAARRLRDGGLHPQWLALRALSTRPLRTLQRVVPDPWGAYEAGDWDRLAALELRDLGLRSRDP